MYTAAEVVCVLWFAFGSAESGSCGLEISDDLLSTPIKHKSTNTKNATAHIIDATLYFFFIAVTIAVAIAMILSIIATITIAMLLVVL